MATMDLVQGVPVEPFVNTDLTAYGLLLLAGLFAMNIWLTHRRHAAGKSDGICPYSHHFAEMKRMLQEIQEDHSAQGHHHKALERTERRVVALMRHMEIRDPDGKF